MDLDERRLRENNGRGASPEGTRLVRAVLPGGRIVRLAVPAPLAPAATVRNLARLAEDVSERNVSAASRHRAGIVRLSHRVADDAARLSVVTVASSTRHRRRLRARYERLDRRITKAADTYRAQLERQIQFDLEAVRRLRRRDLWDQIVVASSLPLFAAYGGQGQPFSTTNLALTLSLLVWLVGDQIVEALFGSDEKAGKPEYPWRDTDIWSYLAPIGNVLTGWWLFGDRQNERFVSGVTTAKVVITATPSAVQQVFHCLETFELTKRIGADHREDFETFKGVPVVATIASTRFVNGIDAAVTSLTAAVDGGTLIVSFDVVTTAPVGSPPESIGEVDIAWIVDTSKPSDNA